MSETPTALLIEDDTDFADTVAQYLVRQGWQWTVTGTVASALDWLQISARPDLILLDISLPDSERLADLLVFLRAQRGPGTPTIPIIILSGGVEKIIASFAKFFGALGFLQKNSFAQDPATLDTLLRALQPAARPDGER